MFMRIAVCLLVMCFVEVTVLAAELKDFEAREYKDAGGNVLLYRIYKPANYDPAKKYPLVLFLHGAGERGNDNKAQVRDALYWARDVVQKDNPCFVVAPQCPGARQVFELYGSRKESDQTFNNYAGSEGQWKSYSIPLAKLGLGEKSWLFLGNRGEEKKADPKAGAAVNAAAPAVSEFRKVTFGSSKGEDKSRAPLNFKNLSFDKREGNGKIDVSEDGSSVTLTGNVRVKVPVQVTVAADTEVRFEFRSTSQGLSHSISVDSDDFFDYRWANMDWSAKKGGMAKAPSTPMRLTLEMLAGLQKEFSIDEKRLYITGLSMGGYGTWDVIARHPEMFAAAAPVCGGADETTAPALVAAKIPIWVFHGGADNVVPTERSRNMVKALKDAGGDPKYTEYPGVGHNSWDKAYSEPELVTWLFSQKLK